MNIKIELLVGLFALELGIILESYFAFLDHAGGFLN